MHDLNSLVKLNVLLFKIQGKKRKNGRREDPVICGSGNLKATSSRAKIIFIFDLNSFSNLKTICSHAISNGLLCMSELTPHSARLANGKLIPHKLIFFNSSCLRVFYICLTSINARLQLKLLPC